MTIPPQRWEKLGLIYRPDTGRPWMEVSLSIAGADQIDERRYRVYLQGRDEDQRFSHWFCRGRPDHPKESLDAPAEPLFVARPIGILMKYACIRRLS